MNFHGYISYVVGITLVSGLIYLDSPVFACSFGRFIEEINDPNAGFFGISHISNGRCIKRLRFPGTGIIGKQLFHKCTFFAACVFSLCFQPVRYIQDGLGKSSMGIHTRILNGADFKPDLIHVCFPVSSQRKQSG